MAVPEAESAVRDVDEGILRRHFVALATAEYDDPRYAALAVSAEVMQLGAWLEDGDRLGGRSFTRAFADLALDPDEDAIRSALRQPARAWTPADAAVVFVTGHGEVADGSHWLVLKDSDSQDLGATAIRTGDLIRWLKRPGGVQHLLLIIDACFAGAAAADTVRFDKEWPKTWLVLPSAAKGDTATTGVLTEAIGAAVALLRSGEGARYGTHRPYFRVSDFLDAVRTHLPGQDISLLNYRGDLNAEHVCLPNPHYARIDAAPTQSARHELALPASDLTTHWAPRAAGTDSTDRWLFTGRADLMRRLIAVARGGPGTTLVTGGAGSGKSAVLARLVTLSDPAFVAAYADRVHEIPDDLRPSVGDVDVAVLATGKYAHEVLGQISHALGAARPDSARGDADLASRVTAAYEALNQRSEPVTVVVDALDEAQDPIGIVRMLAALVDGAPSRVRLLIGVRSLAADTNASPPMQPNEHTEPSPSWVPGSRSLAGQVAAMLSAQQIHVDDASWWQPQDVYQYALSILLHIKSSPYRTSETRQRASELARIIADRVGRSFLVARLAASALTQRQHPVAPGDLDWLASLHEGDDGVVGAFRADLHRIFPDPDERLAAVELLRAVAFAYGRGLPWGEIWPLVANAVADRHGKFGDRDIAELLASPVAAYLITDIEDDVTVYRLFHDALRGTLRTRWQELLETDPS